VIQKFLPLLGFHVEYLPNEIADFRIYIIFMLRHLAQFPVNEFFKQSTGILNLVKVMFNLMAHPLSGKMHHLAGY
jgi:hypothetical protein